MSGRHAEVGGRKTLYCLAAIDNEWFGQLEPEPIVFGRFLTRSDALEYASHLNPRRFTDVHVVVR